MRTHFFFNRIHSSPSLSRSEKRRTNPPDTVVLIFLPLPGRFFTGAEIVADGDSRETRGKRGRRRVVFRKAVRACIQTERQALALNGWGRVGRGRLRSTSFARLIGDTKPYIRGSSAAERGNGEAEGCRAGVQN